MTSQNSSDARAERIEADRAAIRRCLDKVVDAVQAKDLDALAQLVTPDVVSFDIEPPLAHVGVAAKLQNWSNVFALFDTVRYEVRELTFTVGGDVAFGHAFARLGGTKDGQTVTGIWVRVTYGMRKIDDIWLLAHDHVSVPLDIATGKGVVDLEP